MDLAALRRQPPSKQRQLRRSRDALRGANKPESTMESLRPDEINASLAMCAQIMQALDQQLASLQDRLITADKKRLTVADGPFAGELAEAVKVSAAWLALARAHGQSTRDDIANAHIAIGGLAGR